MSPGDQVPPGTPGAGENLCPRCSGKGQLQGGATCTTCNGTGRVVEAVGGGG
jgi:DnaJ-class molecular chaperone